MQNRTDFRPTSPRPFAPAMPKRIAILFRAEFPRLYGAWTRSAAYRSERPIAKRVVNSFPGSDACEQRVETHAIDEFGRVLDVPDRQIALLALFERAQPAEAPECARRFARDAGNALLHSQTKQSCPHVHGQQERRQRRSTGVAIRRNRD